MIDNAFPHIPEAEQTPAVRLLIAFIEQQQEIIFKQQTEIEALKAEVARLKKLPPKPKIRPSKLSKNGTNKGSGKTGKPTKPRKRKKKLTIHNTEIIKPDHIPKAHACLDMRTTPSRTWLSSHTIHVTVSHVIDNPGSCTQASQINCLGNGAYHREKPRCTVSFYPVGG